MSFTVAAWNENIDTGTALTAINAEADQHLTTDGDDVLVPDFAPDLAAVLAAGIDLTQAQVTSPSLRRTLQLDVRPTLDISDIEGGEVIPYMDLWRKPIRLDPGEGLRALQINDGGAASDTYQFAWLKGREARPLPEGRIDTLRTTNTATLTADTWTLITPTLTQQIEAGRYHLAGMRAEFAGALVLRAVIPGSQFRPGIIARRNQNDPEPAWQRHGGAGMSWGEFDHRFFPQSEAFSETADTSQPTWYDLIRAA